MNSKAHNSSRFKQINKDVLCTLWKLNPVHSTFLGVHEYDNTYGDVSPTGLRNTSLKLRHLVEALQSEVEPSILDENDKLDYRLAISLASINILWLESELPHKNNPASYVSSAIYGCFALLRNFAPLEERANSMLERLREIPDMLAVSKENISEPPKIFVHTALENIKSGISFLETIDSEIADKAKTLRHDLSQANSKAAAAFKEYRKWLREEVMQTAREDFALGYNNFQQAIFAEHYLTYSPNDIAILGERTLVETQQKIKEVAAKISPETDIQALLARLKKEHPPKEKLTDAYRDAIESTKDFVLSHDLVTIPDDEHLYVRKTPEFERNVLPYAAYFPPAPFETKKVGILWITPVDENSSQSHQELQLLGHSIHAIPVFALHEGYPGHHVQMSRATEIESPIRKRMMNNLLLEGWALYCEQMMQEQGFFNDPKAELFYLQKLLWRSCRVIIDVGLHTGEMTIDEAVRMLMEIAYLEEFNAKAEVKRYAMSPTQPMSYVIGKLMLLDLRERMRRKLGSGFDLKQFHDELISYGTIPPALISEQMLSQPSTKKETRQLRKSA